MQAFFYFLCGGIVGRVDIPVKRHEFFKTEIVVGYISGGFRTYVTEMERLIHNAGNALFALGETMDESVFRAVLLEPFEGGGIFNILVFDGAVNVGDVTAERRLMLAASGGHGDIVTVGVLTVSDAVVLADPLEIGRLFGIASVAGGEKYGETGGLADTVVPYNRYTGEGTGFSFANYNAHEMMSAVRYAESIYYDHKRDWNKIVERAMAADFSWKVSAGAYQEMYDWLIG